MILVTGATGHIGNVLIRKLVQRKQSVRAFYWQGEKPISLSGVNVEMFPGNILSKASVHEAMQGVETVYHLAGVISILPNHNSIVWDVNVEGTRNVLALAQEHHVKRLIYTSTIHALRRLPKGFCIDETAGFDPENPYGVYDRSKAIASLEVLRAAREGLDAIIICPTGVIGPYDYYHSEMGKFLRSVAYRQAIFHIDGAYDFVDVRDVANGLIAAMEKGKQGESYILGGHQMSIKDLIAAVSRIIGKSIPTIKLPDQLARMVARLAPIYARLFHSRPLVTPYSIEVLKSNSNISHLKAKRELDYAPRPILETINDTLQWFFEEHNATANCSIPL